MAQHLKAVGNRSLNCCRFNSCGFSLLEVMLSAVILTISLLGIAGMYGFSSRFSYEAKQHSLAVNISKHILDGIRINKNAWIDFINLDRENKTIEIIIDGHLSERKLNSELSSSIASDIQSFQQHLSNSFSTHHACAVIHLDNKALSEVVNLSVDVNWRMDVNSNSNSLCHVKQTEKGNKTYHIGAIL